MEYLLAGRTVELYLQQQQQQQPGYAAAGATWICSSISSSSLLVRCAAAAVAAAPLHGAGVAGGLEPSAPAGPERSRGSEGGWLGGAAVPLAASCTACGAALAEVLGGRAPAAQRPGGTRGPRGRHTVAPHACLGGRGGAAHGCPPRPFPALWRARLP